MCQIKKHLEQINKYIIDTAEKISNGDTFEKTTNEIISKTQTFDAKYFCNNYKLNGKKGMYVFMFNKSFKNNYAYFNACYHGAKLTKHLNETEFKEGYVLYVGKANNVYDRLKEHLISCYDNTYSLRLYHSHRKSMISFLKVTCYFIKDDLEDYYSIISRKLEEAVAEKYKDIILTDNK